MGHAAAYMDDKLQSLLPLYRIKGPVLHSQSLSTKHSMSRLGLYHHLLVGQAGKSFIVRALRVVFSGCGCVLRLRPSRFPFFFFFFSSSSSRIAPPSVPFFSSPFLLVFHPVFRCLFSSLHLRLVAPLLPLTFPPFIASPSARFPLPASTIPSFVLCLNACVG